MDEVSNVRDYREDSGVGQYDGGLAQAVTESAVTGRVMRVEKGLNSLGEGLDALSGKLRPVLKPDFPEDRAETALGMNKVVEEPHSPVINDWHRIEAQIARLNRNLTELSKRIEV